MFQHRLGLALGITLGQVKALPNEEYKSWRAYYKIEPFGWEDREYRTAVILAMIYNRSISKQSQAKRTKDMMRDPEKEIEEQHNNAKRREDWLKATKQERIEMLAASIGGIGIEAKIKRGES